MNNKEKNILDEKFDTTFIYQCKKREDRERNEFEIDYLFKEKRDLYIKKMMLEFLKNELMYSEYDLVNSYFYDFFECIVKDLKLKATENKKNSEMHYIGEGYSVIAFKIGDNVITVGRYKDHSIDLPAFKHFLNLKLNRTFPVTNVGREYITIQVMPFVDTKKIKDKEVYEIYKQLRSKGYIWLDCKKNNVGRLLNDNLNPYPDLSETGAHFLGINEASESVLKKGEAVIFDIDGIIPESELKNIKWPIKSSKQFLDMEDTYQKELKKTLGKKLKNN